MGGRAVYVSTPAGLGMKSGFRSTPLETVTWAYFLFTFLVMDLSSARKGARNEVPGQDANRGGEVLIFFSFSHGSSTGR